MNSEKVMPAQIDTEEAIIGCLLFDKNVVYELADNLPMDAFYSLTNRTIYEAMLEINKKNQVVDFMSVSQHLEAYGLLDKVGGMKTLSRLLNQTVSATNLDRYRKLVLDKYFRRLVIACGNDIANIGYDPVIEAEEVRQLSEEKFFNLLDSNRVESNEFEHISISLMEMVDRLDSDADAAIPTGILDLDNKIDGLYPKNLYILAARPSMGKTYVGLNITNHISSSGLNVAFVSAESSKAELDNRLVAMNSGVDSKKIKKGDLTQSERERVTTTIADLIHSNIFINDNSAKNITTNSIRSMLRKLTIKGSKPNVLIVDYLQKLGDRAAVNRAQVVGQLSGDFKDIAKEFNIPVICLAQINREVKNRNDKRPLMSDLKDSGDIEQDADVIMTLYRDEYYNPDTPDRGLLEINVAKNRDGEIGVCKCLFDPSTGNLKNLKQFI